MANKTCYMCESKATSREHVPPKCIFPEKKNLPKNFNFRKNLISVPSCDKHNSHKSKDDEYLMFFLSTNLVGNDHKRNHFKSKVMRAIKRKPHVYTAFMPNQMPIVLKNEETGEVEQSISYQVDLDRFDNIMRHIAHGIYFHHTKEKWVGKSDIFSPAMMAFDGKDRVERNDTIQEFGKDLKQVFSSSEKYGANPEIFQYSMKSGPENQHVMYLDFYNGFEVTIFLGNL